MAHKFGFNQDLMKEFSLGQSFFEEPKNDYNLAEIASGFNKKTMMSPIHAALLSSVIVNKGVIKYPFIISKRQMRKMKNFILNQNFMKREQLRSLHLS